MTTNNQSKRPKAKIVLHGVSMGAATTMMTTGEDLPENVVLAIEDCGFTSVYDIFEDPVLDFSRFLVENHQFALIPPAYRLGRDPVFRKVEFELR